MSRDENARRRLSRNSPQGLVVLVLALAGLCSSFMFTLVVPIQSQLPQLLNASRDDTAWVVTSTLLAAAVITPIAGRLGDMYGKRRIVLVLLVVMILGSVVAALSTGIVGMIVAAPCRARSWASCRWASRSCATCCTRTASTAPSR